MESHISTDEWQYHSLSFGCGLFFLVMLPSGPCWSRHISSPSHQPVFISNGSIEENTHMSRWFGSIFVVITPIRFDSQHSQCSSSRAESNRVTRADHTDRMTCCCNDKYQNARPSSEPWCYSKKYHVSESLYNIWACLSCFVCPR